MIKLVELYGEIVACVSTRYGKYTLIESVCKIFFPGTVLQEFQYAIEKIIKVPIHILSDKEERAFLRFYELPPTAGLSYKSSINITYLKKIIPRLKMMFGGQEKTHAALKRPFQDSSHQKNQQTMKSKAQTPDDTGMRLAKKVALSNHSK